VSEIKGQFDVARSQGLKMDQRKGGDEGEDWVVFYGSV